MNTRVVLIKLACLLITGLKVPNSTFQRGNIVERKLVSFKARVTTILFCL